MRLVLRTFTGLLALLAASPAFAIEQGGVSETVTTTSITTSSGNCLALNPYRRSLTLDLTGGTKNVGYCRMSPATPSTACTAAIGATGTTTLAYGTLHYWPAGSGPQNGFCFIADTSSQPMTIIEGY